MDTSLAAVVHKENAHIGGGKAIVTNKPDELKTAKTAGKKRKALEDRSTYIPVVGASKDVNLKQKSTMKGKKVKKNKMTQGMQGKSDLQGFGKGNKPFDDILTDEEIKQSSEWAPFRHLLTDEEIRRCYEWAKDGIEGIGGYSAEDEENLFMKPNISEFGLSGSKFEEPFTSKEGYETDEWDFKKSAPGRLSSVYRPSVADLWLEDHPLPELKLDDDYEEFSIGSDVSIKSKSLIS